jgi:hypothetical protein
MGSDWLGGGAKTVNLHAFSGKFRAKLGSFRNFLVYY